MARFDRTSAVMNDRRNNSSTISWVGLLAESVVREGSVGSLTQENLDRVLAWLSGKEGPTADLISEEFASRSIADDAAKKHVLSAIDSFLFEQQDDDQIISLGLPPDSDSATIKSRYRRLMQVYHPDRALIHGEWLVKRAGMINDAYAVLSRENGAGVSQVQYADAASRSSTKVKRPPPSQPARPRKPSLRAALGDPRKIKRGVITFLLVASVALLGLLYLSGEEGSQPSARTDALDVKQSVAEPSSNIVEGDELVAVEQDKDTNAPKTELLSKVIEFNNEVTSISDSSVDSNGVDEVEVGEMVVGQEEEDETLVEEAGVNGEVASLQPVAVREQNSGGSSLVVEDSGNSQVQESDRLIGRVLIEKEDGSGDDTAERNRKIDKSQPNDETVGISRVVSPSNEASGSGEVASVLNVNKQESAESPNVAVATTLPQKKTAVATKPKTDVAIKPKTEAAGKPKSIKERLEKDLEVAAIVGNLRAKPEVADDLESTTRESVAKGKTEVPIITPAITPANPESTSSSPNLAKVIEVERVEPKIKKLTSSINASAMKTLSRFVDGILQGDTRKIGVAIDDFVVEAGVRKSKQRFLSEYSRLIEDTSDRKYRVVISSFTLDKEGRIKLTGKANVKYIYRSSPNISYRGRLSYYLKMADPDPKIVKIEVN